VFPKGFPPFIVRKIDPEDGYDPYSVMQRDFRRDYHSSDNWGPPWDMHIFHRNGNPDRFMRPPRRLEVPKEELIH
jgi:hypothetical protein